MSIDGIGKPGGATAPPAIAPNDRSQAAERFQVGTVDSAAQAPDVAGSEALAQLQRGEIGLDDYLEAQVDGATSHLSTLPADQLDFIRQTLREELRTDPVLVELVRRATGLNAADSDR